MILAFDTYYFENRAKTVCISFDDWSNEGNYAVNSEIIEGIEEYVPGEFYRRELPCILSLLGKMAPDQVEAIIVEITGNNAKEIGVEWMYQSDDAGFGGCVVNLADLAALPVD